MEDRQNMTPDEVHSTANQFEELLNMMAKRENSLFGGPKPNRAQRRRNIRGTAIKKSAGNRQIYRPAKVQDGIDEAITL